MLDPNLLEMFLKNIIDRVAYFYIRIFELYYMALKTLFGCWIKQKKITSKDCIARGLEQNLPDMIKQIFWKLSNFQIFEKFSIYEVSKKPGILYSSWKNKILICQKKILLRRLSKQMIFPRRITRQWTHILTTSQVLKIIKG